VERYALLAFLDAFTRDSESFVWILVTAPWEVNLLNFNRYCVNHDIAEGCCISEDQGRRGGQGERESDGH
jgi:hypothetical protein